MRNEGDQGKSKGEEGGQERRIEEKVKEVTRKRRMREQHAEGG